MTIEERVRCVFQKSLLLDEAQIKPEAHLLHDLGVSSLDRCELVMGIEEEFRIELTEQDQESIHTVGDVIERVKLRCPVPSAI